jgi:zinc transporter 1/2/3
MASVFAIFLAEFFAFRIGTEYMERIGLDVDPHVAQGAAGGAHTSHEHRPRDSTIEGDVEGGLENGDKKDRALAFGDDSASSVSDPSAALANPSAQVIGVLILEFGVIFHSIIIGLTLATSDDFTVLFIVISMSLI